ncbi:MAG TPA: hypothetical protein VFA21_15605 [Pyrinomonadaceae bacterium]|nr:hypothetical protein [Pyrinomonadaceae bacterium]
MPARTAEQAMHENARAQARRRGKPQPRMPSTVGYMAVAGGLSLALFCGIWFLLRTDGDDTPWIPAGVAAIFVIVCAAAAREIAMRRAWARYTREMELVMGAGDASRPALKPKPVANNYPGMQARVAALRGLQQRLAELDNASTPPEAHLEAYKLCEQYLAGTDEVLRTPGGAAEMRVALRSGQERVRALQRRHLLAWARGETTRLTSEAQRRVRLSDRIETAQRALEVLGEAMRVCPDEQELRDSSVAVRNFIASVKVGQWVEMAERAAFRGKYSRAVARYRDALFYLSRADMGEDAREEAATRIQREIEMLRARIRTDDDAAPDAATPEIKVAARAARRGPERNGAVEGEELLG